MSASANDKFMKAGAGTVTTLSAPGKALSATSITVGSTTNYPTDTGIVFAIRQVDVNGELVTGTYTEWAGTVTSGTTLSMDAAPVYGSDQVYPAGSTTQVYIPLSSSAHNKMVDGLLVSHDQDGTLKAGAVDNAAVLASDVVETAKIKDANVTPAKRSGGFKIGVIPSSTMNSTGNKSITGVGFKPKLVKFTCLPAVGSSIVVSGGAMDENGNQYAYSTVGIPSPVTMRREPLTDSCILNTDQLGGYLNQAKYTSMDADGFTINVINAGNTNVAYEAYA